MLLRDYKIFFALALTKIGLVARPEQLKIGKIISIFGGLWIKGLNRRVSIAKKIRYGYSLAISVVIIGTSTGLVIGEYYQKKALEQLNLAQQNSKLLTELEISLIKNYDHPEILTINLKISTLTKRGMPEKMPNILNLIRGNKINNLSIKFEQIAKDLSRLKNAAKAEEIKANENLNRVEILRLVIIIGSMLLSSAIAIVLGFYTSREIARPIKWVHQVALSVTQQSNFKLIAPVFNEDDVGSLAASLNQLVQWVGEYTQELEIARHTLEQRVQERTQELQQTLEELKQTQAQLIQSEKMSSLGYLVAGIAHEINNPTNFIYGNIQYLNGYIQELLELVHLYQQHYPSTFPEIEEKIQDMELNFISEDLLKILGSIKMGTERIKKIILSLRNFSRLDEADLKIVDIHEGIDNTLLILNHRIQQGIEIIKQYEELPLIECYPVEINQVFFQIIFNAIDILEERKNIESKFFNSCLPKITITTQKVSEYYIQIVIKDNGMGIKNEIRNKIFDPFFTTKPMGKGTGLGLYICYNIVQKHRGKIEVFSVLGVGTEFIINLPIKN